MFTRDAFKTPVKASCKQAKKFNHIFLKSTAQLNLCTNDFHLIAYVLVVTQYFQDGFSRTSRHPSFTFSPPSPFTLSLSFSHFVSLSLHEHLYNLTPSKNDKYLGLFSGVCVCMCVWFWHGTGRLRRIAEVSSGSAESSLCSVSRLSRF